MRVLNLKQDRKDADFRIRQFCSQNGITGRQGIKKCTFWGESLDFRWSIWSHFGTCRRLLDPRKSGGFAPPTLLGTYTFALANPIFDF